MGTTHKISDTLAFLTIARKVIYELIEESSFSRENLVSVRNFILNEASDYEIMSILLDGNLPLTKYDLVMESVCYNKLKKTYGAKFDFVPLSLYNLSSQPYVRRFIVENKLFEQDETEKWKDKAEEEIKNRNLVKKLPNVPIKQKELLDKKAEYSLLKYKESEAEKKIKTGKERDQDVSDIEKEKEEYSERAEETGEEIQDISQDISTQSVAGTAFSVAGSTAKSIAISSIFRSIEGGIGKGIAFIRPMLSAFLASPAGQLIGSAILVSIISFASYKTFKHIFMKAKVACEGFQGEEKDQCIMRYKIDALQAKVNDLKSGLPYCIDSEDPAKCSAKINSKINKTMEKIKKIKDKGIV
jgi:hypothetical protein